jgi:hypothetical protein
MRGLNEAEFELASMAIEISAFGVHEMVTEPVPVVGLEENTS